MLNYGFISVVFETVFLMAWILCNSFHLYMITVKICYYAFLVLIVDEKVFLTIWDYLLITIFFITLL